MQRPADDTASGPRTEAVVQIQHAAPRDDITEDVDLGAFMARWDGFFVDGGGLIDQPFVSRVSDGMIRVYLVRDQVVGFALQQPDPAMDPDRVLGLPSGKTMFNEDYPAFGSFAPNWNETGCPACSHPQRCRQTISRSSGTPTSSTARRADAYLLCEINVSSVLPFPPHAPSALARAIETRLTITG